MNQQNMQQAMMAHQSMQQGLPQGGIGQDPQMRLKLANHFQSIPATKPWHTLVEPRTRVGRVLELATSFSLAKPSTNGNDVFKQCMNFEAQQWKDAQSKDQYELKLGQQLQGFANMRQQAAQAQQLQMGNQQNLQNGMSLNQNQMQQNMPNQGNQGNTPFNSALQRPMQVTPIPPGNGQNPVQMSMNMNQNGGQGAQQLQQAQPNMGMGQPLTQQDNQRINALAINLRDRASEELKNKMMAQINAWPAEKLQAMRQKFGHDLLLVQFRQQAQALFNSKRQQMGMASNQMPQQIQQQGNQAAGAQNHEFDYSTIAGQQADAMRLQDAGALVVPASNHNNLTQLGLPMGLQGQQGGQPGQMPSALQQMQAQQQNFMNQQQQAQGQGTPQQQAQARMMQAQILQRRQMQAQQQAQQQQQQQQQAQNQQQSQGALQQMNMQRQMAGPQQSPMSLLTQPVNQPPQQASTPQPRPQGLPPQLNARELQTLQQQQQQQQQAQQRQQQPLRQLPPHLANTLPLPARNALMNMPEDQYIMAIQRIENSQRNFNGPNPALGQAQFTPGPPMGLQGVPQGANQSTAQMQWNAQQRLNQMRPQQGQPMPASLMFELDSKPFPRSFLTANNIIAPEHVKTWQQLKEFVMQHPAQSNGVTPQTLMRAQAQLHAQQQQRQLQQQSLGNPQFGGQPGIPPAGPAPTAPMMPGGMNPQQQQQQQARMAVMNGGMPGMAPNMQSAIPPNFTVSPQEIAQVRANKQLGPETSNERVREIIYGIRLAQMKARQAQMQAQNQQTAQIPPLQQQQQQALNAQQEQQRLNAQRIAANQQVHQQRMQLQQPQIQQPGFPQNNGVPQMNGQAPGQTANRQPQRPPQSTPQPQAGKGLKRPAPDEVIELDQSPAQAPAMQVSASQQQQQRAAPLNSQQMQQRNQMGQLPDPVAQKAMMERKFAEMSNDATTSTPQQPPVPLSPQDRQQMINKIREHHQVIGRIDQCIKLYWSFSKDELRTRQFLKQSVILSQNVNVRGPGMPLIDHPSIDLSTLDNFLNGFRQVVGLVMAKAKQTAEMKTKAQQMGQAGQMAPQHMQQQRQPMQQQSMQGMVTGGPQFDAPQQHVLNASNLEQQQQLLRQQNQQQQQQAAIQHKRNNSKAQAPPAPTAGPGQNPFPFNVPSPTPAGAGVPQYGEGAKNLTSDNLKMPAQPRKRTKPNARPSQSAASTPAQPPSAMSPVVGKATSPDSRRLPGPDATIKMEPQRPVLPFKCPEKDCHERGFETAEQLANHKNTMHTLNLSGTVDGLSYSINGFGTALSIQADGSRKATVKKPLPSKPSQTPVGKQESASPAGVVTTPMARVATQTKESPALDRLKTPQQGPKAPPTSAAPVSVKTKEPAKNAEQPAGPSIEDFTLDVDSDPWSESSIQPQEMYDLFNPFDTLTGDWGYDRALDSPATTPDTNISKDTTSTRETDISENDNVNITLGLEGVSGEESMLWHPIEDHWASAMDASLAQDIGSLGVDESLILRLDGKTEDDLMDWDGMFGPNSTFEGNKVPSWDIGEDIPI